MQKLFFVILISLSGWHGLQPVNGQTRAEIDHLLTLLEQEKYVDLINKVGSMRQKAYYKNAFMDYCLAYGYCQLKMPEMSKEWFTHILKSYNTINVEKEQELLLLRDECSSTQVASNPTLTMVNYLSSMSNDAFEGNTAGIESKMGIPNPREKVMEIDFENARFDVANRQFTLSEKEDAWQYYSNILKGDDSSLLFDTTRHLLVIYSKTAGNIMTQVAELEKYYQYYNTELGLGTSDRLITVFYFSNRTEFDDGSLKLHNIKVPASTYGYTSSVDLILTGIARSSWLGALKHELFHLMVRSSVGDVPPWMDEGIACLFESSSLPDNGPALFNMDNYRTTLLGNLSMVRDLCDDPLPLPVVSEFINYSWLDFSGRPGDLMMKASINYSISYVFSKYLLDKGKLQKIIEAYRNRTFEEKINTPESGNETLTVIHIRQANQLVEGSTGMKLEEIQLEFEDWCRKNLGFNPYL